MQFESYFMQVWLLNPLSLISYSCIDESYICWIWVPCVSMAFFLFFGFSYSFVYSFAFLFLFVGSFAFIYLCANISLCISTFFFDISFAWFYSGIFANFFCTWYALFYLMSSTFAFVSLKETKESFASKSKSETNQEDCL